MPPRSEDPDHRDGRHHGRARCAEGALAPPWTNWYRKALRGGIAPLRHFALTCRASLVHCRYPLGTDLVEGINYKIKVKRMAYGFRDDAYLLLKSRAAFPGVGR